MFEIKTDVDKNRIYMNLGKIEKGEAEKLYKGVEEELMKVKKGFTSVVDITDFQVLEPNEAFYAGKLQKLMADAGLKISVRTNRNVQKDQTKDRQQSESVLVETKLGYLTGTAENIETAEKLIDEALAKISSAKISSEAP